MNELKTRLIESDVGTDFVATSPKVHNQGNNKDRGSFIKSIIENANQKDSDAEPNLRQSRHIQLNDIIMASDTGLSDLVVMSDEWDDRQTSSELHVSFSRKDPFKLVFSGAFEVIVDYCSSGWQIYVAIVVCFSAIMV